MYFIGYDIGSSSVKATLLDGQTGKSIVAAQYPKTEMPMIAHQLGWAEQNPAMWWDAVVKTTQEILSITSVDKSAIKAVGISYQMHGLVAVDKHQQVLRASVIWCDSRAVNIGNEAFEAIGKEKCLAHLLNSPGNFTASKLKWVKENEPEIYSQIDKIMLPGDYIAMKMSGVVNTTVSGLSEGIFWDFKNNQLADFLLEHYGFSTDLIPDIVPTFSDQSALSASAAAELGLAAGTKITYRAGDQPNNALSLNVLNAGEIAATAGTSGVVYGVSDQVKYDSQSRVNTFAHVNHTEAKNRLGVLLCINGTGILNAWLNRTIGNKSYEEMNELASRVPIGSEGLTILPFGNGAERVLGNRNLGSLFANLNFNTHSAGHLFRAAQEGIVFSLQYGLDIMKGIGITPKVVRAGQANMFLSPIFKNTFANLSNTVVELYNTDGSQGAARGAMIGSGHCSTTEAFRGLDILETIEPQPNVAYEEAYQRWLSVLEKQL